ncbi:hypothetical protein [Clostridium sp.]|uniref:hypothetical protein n=2 Tax=Clostridium sp. TaxID=1506 RepID=UPI002FC6634C
MKTKSRGFIFVLIILLVGLVLGGGFVYLKYDFINYNSHIKLESNYQYEENRNKRPGNSGIFVLANDIKEHKGTYAAFTSVGFDVLSGGFSEYIKNADYQGVFVFPESEVKNLSNKEIQTIKDNINKGQKAIVTGDSKLAKELGIKVKYSKMVNEYYMIDHKETAIETKERFKTYKVDYPEGYKTLANAKLDDQSILGVGKFGKGKVLYSASELVPKDGSGYEIYPFIIDTVVKNFEISPVYSRNNGAVYLDIGYHIGIETPAQVAEKAKKWGFDQINVGVWSEMNKDNVEYYKGIIEESHKRGIKVFAWFEFPMVSVDFWEKHPEWRQKTADGKDAKIDWRYLMALENKECFEAAKDVVSDIMNRFEFDGIDIAEIYYEGPGRGFDYPDHFTPMNDAFREDFKKKHGFDPKDSFNIKSEYYWRANEEAKNKIIEERVRLITEQHREMLELVEELRVDQPHLESNVTMIDSIADPRMRSDIGLDANQIVELQKKYNFIMEIEDPFTLWTLGPDRYSVIGENYRKVMDPKDRLYIDINIIDRFVRSYPTVKQRDTEVYSLIHNASKYTDKVIMYALATLEEEDMDLAPYAYAADVKGKEVSENVYEFEGKYNFTWHIDMKGKEVYVDGVKSPAYTDEYIIIPAGKHRIEIKDATNTLTRIKDINSTIIESSYKGESINIKYNSYGRCFINVTKKPTSIVLNGKIINPEIKELNGEYTIMLPKGENTVVIK